MPFWVNPGCRNACYVIAGRDEPTRLVFPASG